MNALPLPLADVAGIISAVAFVVFLLLGLLSHMAGRPREDPPRSRPKAPPNDPVAAEVNEFLERAQRRRAQVAPQRPAPLPTRPAPPSRPFDDPIEAEIIELDEQPQHVAPGQREVGSGQVGARQLGTAVAQSDHAFDAREHQVFDHQLGRLAATPPTAPQTAVVEASTPTDRIDPAAQALASDLIAMLSNPADLRRAILVSEILNRPESRWE